MSSTSSQKGFTLTEILIALSIMALGFLAMAQMQYLSIRQKQQAELGTVATNVIQFIADRDMEEVKRAHLLNSIAYIHAQAGDPNMDKYLAYCNSSNVNRMCDPCPCDPLAEVTSHPSQETETTCAVIDIHDFDLKKVVFKTTKAECSGGNNDSLIVIKNVKSDTSKPQNSNDNVTTLKVTYGVKTRSQFDETSFDSLSITDTLATQNMAFSAQEDDWSQYLNDNNYDWTKVNVPHVP